MLDSEKIEIIRKMLEEFWECGFINAECPIVMLNAISSVVNFKRKD